MAEVDFPQSHALSSSLGWSGVYGLKMPGFKKSFEILMALQLHSSPVSGSQIVVAGLESEAERGKRTELQGQRLDVRTETPGILAPGSCW